MIRASELKKGEAVKIDGDPCIVESITIQTPGARGAVTLYKIRFRNALTKRKADHTFRGDDVFDEADIWPAAQFKSCTATPRASPSWISRITANSP
jgi:elongation factor P